MQKGDCKRLLQWQETLWENTSAIHRIGIGYGIGGNLFYYLLLAKYCPNDRSDFYISETLSEIISRVNDDKWNYPDLAEVFYLIVKFSDELGVCWDVSDLITQLNEILKSEAKLLIKKGKFESYTGAFNFGYVSLVTGYNPGLVRELIRAVKDNFKSQPGYGKRVFKNSSSIELNVTHGVAFYLVFLSLCRIKNHITDSDIYIIKEHCDFLLEQRADYESCKMLFRDGSYDKNYAKSLNISYGDCGIVYSLISANRCLKIDISKDITSLLNQKLDSNVPRGFGLLYGYSGLHTFHQSISEWPANPANVQRSQCGFYDELEIARHAIDSGEIKLPLGLYEGITGCLALFLAQETDNMNKIRELLNLV